MESKSIKPMLSKIAEVNDKNDILYVCKSCNQLWQESFAWNVGNGKYFFKVPKVEVNDWSNLPFIKPHELMLYCTAMGDFLRNNNFDESDNICQNNECNVKAVKPTVFCQKHHILNLQKTTTLPSDPKGVYFSPYLKENIVPPILHDQ
ncbi:MAG: hypothetical protein OCD76_19275 [Reichenbachiella sp.]